MKYLLVAIGVILSASAQAFMKLAAAYLPWSPRWLAAMGGSALVYALSFACYSVILRAFPLSRVGPVMTVCVASLAALAGLLFGERIGARQILGMGLGAAAVLLIAAP